MREEIFDKHECELTETCLKMILVPVPVVVYPNDVVRGVGLEHLPHPLADRPPAAAAVAVPILSGDGEGDDSLTRTALISRRPAQTEKKQPTFLNKVA